MLGHQVLPPPSNSRWSTGAHTAQPSKSQLPGRSFPNPNSTGIASGGENVKAMRIFQAISVFFQVLLNRDFATQLQQLGSSPEPTTPKVEAAPKAAPTPPKPKAPARNDAVTLLATLQREARFVDIVMEPLGDYTDAQVGAATRDVLRDCGQTLKRLFDITPVVNEEEGATLETPAEVDAARYRLTGKVAGEPPFRGQLVHHGWQAAQCELPKWSGKDDAALIVAPVEIEIA